MAIKILIVEDEPIIAADIEMSLQSNGYLVVGIAHNSIKALDMVNSRRPDFIILDIRIRGERNGIELAEIIRENYDIPFIFLTSFSDPETLNEVKTTLPYGYLVKPFKEKDLIASVEMALYRAETERSERKLSLADINTLATSDLTQQEFIILEQLHKGKTNIAISSTLGVSVNTVKTHLKNVFLKLEVHTRTELMVKLR